MYMYVCFFSPGGKEGARHFSGAGEDPQKVIGFDHFLQENDIFFLVSLKVEGQDILQRGNCPLNPCVATPLGYNHRLVRIQMYMYEVFSEKRPM